MKFFKTRSYPIFTLIGLLTAGVTANAQTKPVYHIYAGSTHAHTSYTESHGAQWNQIPNMKPYQSVDSNGVQHPEHSTMKPDAAKFQGPPSVHYAIAKANGYDFYITTDHSQEPIFYPVRPDNAAWVGVHQQAAAATDKSFVAIAGYEHSENNGPGATGHLNVINTRPYLSALAKGIDIKYLYKWLDTVSAYGDGPVVATFNHPTAKAYDNWAYRDPKVTDVITMLEMINSNTNIHYDAFIGALDAGWKVAPVCGNDNHGTMGIASQKSRTFVLATAKTKAAILDAMKNRRVYASMDNNIQCRYTVNGEIMGSTLKGNGTYKFDIDINDPDTGNPDDKITKIDIVKDGGQVVQTYDVKIPVFAVKWSPEIKDATAKYFFIRIWSVGGGDAPKAKLTPDKPMTWLAPVWTGR
ncbi:hypothetical protein HQ865_07625 [Mucilaginibacter mali]|uniref:Uncharacterized protein n=1 Tax=Mucilaginibacter mali TaxID=2740462 RepID=A0A7D4Q098_9SPHI|nr:hypothetical protein [Mucilaginibacter mali]QKJ29626.1 hypothetical protein HQ865_07625 [Mucilaginibacter mali]